jgi:hypothetical protein
MDYKQFAVTEDPEEAARSLFEEAMPAMGQFPATQVYETFLEACDSETVHRGSESEVRELVLADLRHMAKEPGFKSFRVENSGGAVYRQSQVLCFMGELSRAKMDIGVPVSAWFTDDSCVASGIDPSWK